MPKALSFLQESAALHEPRAMDLLGTHFRKLRQFDQARKYYEDAAAEGYALSLSNLGVLYMNGEGVQRSPEIAANLFKQGAEKGDPVGMCFYAGCLDGGSRPAEGCKGGGRMVQTVRACRESSSHRVVSEQRSILQVGHRVESDNNNG